MSWAQVAAAPAPVQQQAPVQAPAPVQQQAPAQPQAPAVHPREQRKLQNIFRDLDKGKRKPPEQRFGSGSTADAVRHELANPGARVGGREHSEKARNYARALDNWVARNPHAPANLLQEARERSQDLKDALNGQ